MRHALPEILPFETVDLLLVRASVYSPSPNVLTVMLETDVEVPLSLILADMETVQKRLVADLTKCEQIVKYE